MKVFAVFVLLGTCTEIVALLYKTFYAQNTMPIGNIYIPLSIFVLGLFYIKALDGFVPRIISIGGIVLYELFCVANIIFFQNLTEFPSVTGSLGSLLMISFSILLFLKIMVDAKIDRLFQEPMIWLNMGVLIYFSASLFYFSLFNYSVKISHEFAYKTVLVNVSALATFYLLIAIGFWKAGKQAVSSGS